MEIREIPGYPGYSVSDEGKVRGPSGRWLKPKIGRYGHQSVWINGKWPQVHRLVLLAFVGPCPEGHECAHENGDPTDNRISNLRWKTHAANIEDRARHGRTVRGDTHGSSKLTSEQVREIRRLYAEGGEGVSHRSLARQFGITHNGIGVILRRKVWRDLPQ